MFTQTISCHVSCSDEQTQLQLQQASLADGQKHLSTWHERQGALVSNLTSESTVNKLLAVTCISARDRPFSLALLKADLTCKLPESDAVDRI